MRERNGLPHWANLASCAIIVAFLLLLNFYGDAWLVPWHDEVVIGAVGSKHCPRQRFPKRPDRRHFDWSGQADLLANARLPFCAEPLVQSLAAGLGDEGRRTKDLN
jgi:hypothetical protein